MRTIFNPMKNFIVESYTIIQLIINNNLRELKTAAKRLPIGNEGTESSDCTTVGGGVQQEGLADVEDAREVVSR
jgi:hypothetical protein